MTAHYAAELVKKRLPSSIDRASTSIRPNDESVWKNDCPHQTGSLKNDQATTSTPPIIA
jgi:hypothetical protein